MNEFVRSVGENTVVIRDGIIVVTPHGSPHGIMTGPFRLAIEAAVQHQRQKHKTVHILVDMRKVRLRDTKSSGRREVRKLLELPVDNWAIVGKGSVMTMGAYLARLAQRGERVQFFRSMPRAVTWLKTGTKPHQHQHHVLQYGFTLAILIALAAGISLLGWPMHNDHLRSWLSNARPINPVSAIAVACLGFLLCLTIRSESKMRLRATGLSVIVFGLLGLCYAPFGFLIYNAQLHALGSKTGFAYTAAFCFIGCGLFMVLRSIASKSARFLAWFCAISIFLVSLTNIVVTLYARSSSLNGNSRILMSIGLAACFSLCAGICLLSLLRERWVRAVRSIGPLGFLTITAFVLLQFTVYAAWNQAIDRNNTQAEQQFMSRSTALNNVINNNMNNYLRLLKSYKGVYASSNTITEGEFHTYSDIVGTTTNYPGIDSVAFISQVTTAQIPSFIRLHSDDKTYNPNGHPGLQIQALSSAPVHFISTYATTTTPTGPPIIIDLTSYPKRSEIYGQAIASGEIHSSGDLILASASKTDPPKHGFFLTVPVSNEASANYIGVVNVAFDYKNFFPTLLDESSANSNGLKLTVNDGESGKLIFGSNQQSTKTLLHREIRIPVANKSWRIELWSDKNSAVSAAQRHLPLTMLAAGQIIAGLLVILFIVQSRTRREAIKLADAITTDLRIERNNMFELTERDEAILDGIGEGLIVTDEHGRVERVNRAATNLLGLSEADLKSKTYTELVNAFDKDDKPLPPSHRPVATAIAESRVVSSNTVQYEHINGRRFPVQLNVAPVLLNGKLIGAIEIFRDITKERELEKAKDEFVSLASHQLRTPLSTINWYLEMVLNGDAGKLTAKQKQYLNDVSDANKRMVALVNALLNVSRVDLGTVIIEPAAIDLSKAIDDVLSELASQIKQKNLNITKHLDRNLTTYNTDPRLMHIIFQNLISNAVKYTPDNGRIDIAISKQLKHLIIEVTDNGYGIPKQQHSKIFGKLFRADNVQMMDTDGTGLGLYIVKAIIQKAGGTISFVSTEGKGTTFTIELPASGMKQRSGTSRLERLHQ